MGAGWALAGTTSIAVTTSQKAGVVMAKKQMNHWFFSRLHFFWSQKRPE